MALPLYQNDSKMSYIEANRPTLSKEELKSVLDCLIQDRLGPGRIVRSFEKTFSRTFGYKNVVALNSLASAYHLAFLALGLKANDSVIMSALAPIQACDAVRYIGARPVLIDVDRNSFHPAMEKIEEKTEELKKNGQSPAIFILDHSFGSISPLKSEFFRRENINIVEDFTGIVGSEVNGAFTGNQGHIGVCGLAVSDLLTTGNGAMAVTASQLLFKKMQSLRYGSVREINSVAFDYQTGDFQAAMGLDQISRFGIIIERRKKIGQRYMETLRFTPHESYFKDPGIDAYLKFPLLINHKFEKIQRYFNSLQIEIVRAIETPLHNLLNLPRMEFLNSERIYQKAVAIPVYPGLTAGNVERITTALRGLV